MHGGVPTNPHTQDRHLRLRVCVCRARTFAPGAGASSNVGGTAKAVSTCFTVHVAGAVPGPLLLAARKSRDGMARVAWMLRTAQEREGRAATNPQPRRRTLGEVWRPPSSMQDPLAADVGALVKPTPAPAPPALAPAPTLHVEARRGGRDRDVAWGRYGGTSLSSNTHL